MSSERYGKMRTSLLLSVLMVLMTQVGYLDVLNTWSEGEHTLDATTAAFESSSGSSQSNFRLAVWLWHEKLTAVGNTLYFQPTTEPTESNCGRAMEQPQAR
jgi:hypothetical protein